MAGAEAVCAGVAAADDEDVLAGSEDGAAAFMLARSVFRVALVAAILLGQELHGVVDAFELAAGDGKSRGCSEPPQSRMASKPSLSDSTETLTPTWALIWKMTPL